MRSPSPILSFLLLVATVHDGAATTANDNHQDVDTTSQDATTTTTTYGVDVSFPVHGRVSTNYPHLPHNVDPRNNKTPHQYENQPIQTLGNRQQVYIDHLNGCRAYYEPTKQASKCDVFEYDRILMNNRQPQSMVNLTTLGFQKIRAPPNLKELVDDFWEKNHNRQKTQPIENWGAGNSYMNHWDSPTTLVSVDDTGLRGSGKNLKENIWAAASATLEEWTQQELQPCSLYGIRVYHEGAVMLPHVDRLPLVASAIIGVAEDLDEDWPWEVYDHQGNAHNVTIHPGDMLLFESHSVIHGHPFPLKGRYQASIFIHFEPTGHALGRNESGYYYLPEGQQDMEYPEETFIGGGGGGGGTNSKKAIDHQHRTDTKNGIGGQSSVTRESSLPPYVKRESPEEEHWRAQHPRGWSPPYPLIPPGSHIAAKEGRLDVVQQELQGTKKQNVLTERDENGWQILHSAIWGGNQDVVKLLVSNGAELNARTHGGYGETPLRMAEKRLGSSSPIVSYLKGLGALSIGPEL